MKQYEVRLAAAAYEDLDAISAYITYTLQEPLTATRLLARLQEQISFRWRPCPRATNGLHGSRKKASNYGSSR